MSVHIESAEASSRALDHRGTGEPLLAAGEPATCTIRVAGRAGAERRGSGKTVSKSCRRRVVPAAGRTEGVEGLDAGRRLRRPGPVVTVPDLLLAGTVPARRQDRKARRDLARRQGSPVLARRRAPGEDSSSGTVAPARGHTGPCTDICMPICRAL